MEWYGGTLKQCGRTVWNGMVEQWNSVKWYGGTVKRCGGTAEQHGGTV